MFEAQLRAAAMWYIGENLQLKSKNSKNQIPEASFCTKVLFALNSFKDSTVFETGKNAGVLLHMCLLLTSDRSSEVFYKKSWS